MKKTLALILAVIMMLSLLCACGGTKEKVTLKILDTAYTTEDYAIAFAKNSDLTEEVNGALEALIADGTVKAVIDKYISGKENDLKFQQDAEGKEELKMATNANFPPYEYHENNEILGIDAEIAAAICDKLGKKLVIEDMEFDSILASVQSGKCDFGMAGLTVTEDRLKNVDFSTSYATGVQVVIVPEGSPITTVDDLFVEGKNYHIGVQNATTGDIYASGDFEDSGLGTVERYSKAADAIQALVTGKIDCVIIDNEPAKTFVEANNK